MTTQRFNPINYGFTFTADWYEFDSKAAHAAARKARSEEAKRLRKEGRKVKCFTNGKQLMTRGGIGSGKPQIDVWVSVYCLAVVG
jgi:hypothetical protein